MVTWDLRFPLLFPPINVLRNTSVGSTCPRDYIKRTETILLVPTHSFYDLHSESCVSRSRFNSVHMSAAYADGATCDSNFVISRVVILTGLKYSG